MNGVSVFGGSGSGVVEPGCCNGHGGYQGHKQNCTGYLNGHQMVREQAAAQARDMRRWFAPSSFFRGTNDQSVGAGQNPLKDRNQVFAAWARPQASEWFSGHGIKGPAHKVRRTNQSLVKVCRSQITFDLSHFTRGTQVGSARAGTWTSGTGRRRTRAAWTSSNGFT